MNYSLNTSIISPNKSVKTPLFYTPEPGYYDGPEFTFTTPYPLSSVDGFEPGIIEAESIFAYLDMNAPDRGGTFGENEAESVTEEETKEKQINAEISRSHSCGSSAVVMVGNKTSRIGYHALKCRKPWCKTCGGKSGEIHKRRKQALYEKIDMEKENLRQTIFTVPKEDRYIFFSREKLNGLIRSAERIAKDFFPERKQIAIPHIFGDPHPDNPDNDLEYNPHVNILTIENKSEILKLSEGGLEAIRRSWRRALIGHGCTHVDVVDVHYSFRIKEGHKGHSIKYMTRPTWGERQLVNSDQKMRKFLVLDMKGFSYIRYFGELAKCKYHEESEMTESEELTIVAATGEKWSKIGYDKNINFMERVARGEMEEVVPGFFVLKKELKKRHEISGWGAC